MGESTILNTPILLLFFGIALGLCLFDRVYRNTRGWFTLCSAALAVGTAAYALILGAGMGETVTVLLLFLRMNLGGWK